VTCSIIRPTDEQIVLHSGSKGLISIIHLDEMMHYVTNESKPGGKLGLWCVGLNNSADNSHIVSRCAYAVNARNHANEDIVLSASLPLRDDKLATGAFLSFRDGVIQNANSANYFASRLHLINVEDI